MAGELEWDEDKRLANIASRGVDFLDAQRIDWSSAQIFLDDRADYGEERFISRGLIDGRLFVLVYTLRNDRLRVISLRKANRRECKAYARETGRQIGDT